MSFSTRVFRIVAICVLTVVFFSTAYYLFQKQNEKYTFDSFRIENELAAVMIPNIDRLCEKINSVDDLKWIDLPIDLSAGIQLLIDKKNFLFSEEISQDCFLSYNATDFSIAFKTSDLDAAQLADLITLKFEVDCKSNENTIELNGKIYNVANHNEFIVISTAPVSAVKNVNKKEFGNADYIFYTSQHPQGSRHIISNEFHHQVWEDSIVGPSGRPITHVSYLQYIPSSFQEIYFYGSSRMESDQTQFFNQPSQGSFKWVDGGLVVIKKDSFCLMISPQNLEQDLQLILEEQTLVSKNDSVQIPYFNIGPFEIMPFTSSFNWHSSIPNVTEQFKYFTILENYNIVANSIPAMRWYLGELQLGNLFFKNAQLKSVYQNAIPQRSHCVSVIRDDKSEFILTSKIWRTNQVCINTSTQIGSSYSVTESVQLIADFDVEMIPTHITTIQNADSVLILLNNINQVVVFNSTGAKKWSLNLSTALTGNPQIIDLENDGRNEIVLFQTNQIDVVNSDGKSINGFPKKLDGISKSGLAVNYDNAFNYRFIVNSGNSIKSFDENGALVQGWLFPGMSSGLNGSISYYASQGKDLIAFKDLSNKQYILNRKGESRLTKAVTVSLPNETDFAVGNYEASSLRKMGYKNNFIYNYYLIDGQRDSVKLDKVVMAISVHWLFNDNHPLLVIEELERIIIFDEFGYEKNSVLKPNQSISFSGTIVKQDFIYVFVDNSQNTLYLLNGYGKMIFPLPIKGSSVFYFQNDLLYTFVGTKIKIYKTD